MLAVEPFVEPQALSPGVVKAGFESLAKPPGRALSLQQVRWQPLREPPS
jgi:hypothetical protein